MKYLLYYECNIFRFSKLPHKHRHIMKVQSKFKIHLYIYALWANLFAFRYFLGSFRIFYKWTFSVSWVCFYRVELRWASISCAGNWKTPSYFREEEVKGLSVWWASLNWRYNFWNILWQWAQKGNNIPMNCCIIKYVLKYITNNPNVSVAAHKALIYTHSYAYYSIIYVIYI